MQVCRLKLSSVKNVNMFQYVCVERFRVAPISYLGPPLPLGTGSHYKDTLRGHTVNATQYADTMLDTSVHPNPVFILVIKVPTALYRVRQAGIDAVLNMQIPCLIPDSIQTQFSYLL